MPVTQEPSAKLGNILHKSREQVAQISRGEFELAAESLDITQKQIREFLANPQQLNLQREQLEQLQEIYTLQRQAAAAVGELKKELAKKIKELRQGRNLHEIYKVQSLPHS